MARPSPSREWLDRILAGETPDLRALVSDCPVEDLFLDYKAGKELAKPDKGATTVREYVAAFANSSGGMLVLGYDQKAGTFDGVKPVGQTSPHDWATRSLAPVASYLLPPPVIRPATVDGPHGPLEVIVIATQRSPRLVPVRRGAETAYMLRIGDSTLEWDAIAAPHYLATDLLTARRAAPHLAVHHIQIRIGDENLARSLGEHGSSTRFCSVSVRMDIENLSLTVAEDVRIGLITWRDERWATHNYGRLEPSRSLSAEVEVSAPEAGPDPFAEPHWVLSHIPAQRRAVGGGSLEVGPFEIKPDNLLDFVVPVFARASDEAAGQAYVESALYLLPRNCEPQWYQVGFSLDLSAIGAPITPLCKPCYGRPSVSVRYFAEPPD
jgi:hypothetical protein